MEQKTFREAYDVLQRHAETLRNQGEPNIDDLLNIVNESVEAYKVCKERIDAVEKALEAALEGAGLDAPARAERPASASSAAAPAGRPRPAPKEPPAPDDEIPF